ncbi:MAG: HTH-type transcriptional regulator MalT [Enterocloster aldenensis]
MTALIYIQAFCCCFMVGFETATMVYYFSEMSIVRHVLLAYPVAYTAVAVLQNDFFKIDYASFRILTVAMLVLLLLFFCKMPTKVCPRFVKKSDGLIMPKRFFTGVLLLVFLSALLGVIAPAVAAQYKHGVFVAYIGCVVCCLTVYALHKITGKHPIQFMPYVVGIASLGYILLFVSHYASGLALIACALIPLFGVLMSRQYPSKFIAPGMIGLAMLAVITHSIIIELFRTSAIFLNITYLILVVVLAFLFVLTEPYLIYVMRRQFAPMADEQKEAPSLEEAQEPPLPDVSVQVEAPTETEQTQASLIALLTKREHEVLELINYGYSNADIAKMLFISEYTVKDHTKKIYRKMGVHSRFELAAKVNRYEEK